MVLGVVLVVVGSVTITEIILYLKAVRTERLSCMVDWTHNVKLFGDHMKVGDILALTPSGVYTHRWAVQGRAKDPYTVSIRRQIVLAHAKDFWGCSCPDWSKHTPRIDCKHILQVKLQQHPPMSVLPTIKPVQRTGRFFRDVPAKDAVI